LLLKYKCYNEKKINEGEFMAHPPLGRTNDGDVVSFNTADILVYLFKESAKERQFTDEIACPLAHLDSQIAKTTNAIRDHLTTELKQEWDAAKALLAAAQKSPKRDELVKLMTELEGKVTNLNIQGELLLEQCRNVTAQFWKTLVHSTLADKKIPSAQVEQINRVLEDLNNKAQPFMSEEEQIIAKFNSAKITIENMTGRTIDSVTATPQSPKMS
jgi:hypothetical protein